MGAITQILRALFTSATFSALPVSIEVSSHNSKTLRVTVVTEVLANSLQIPPCCPKTAKLVTNTENAFRAPIKVTRQYEDIPTEHTYYLLPEFVMPETEL